MIQSLVNKVVGLVNPAPKFSEALQAVREGSGVSITTNSDRFTSYNRTTCIPSLDLAVTTSWNGFAWDGCYPVVKIANNKSSTVLLEESGSRTAKAFFDAVEERHEVARRLPAHLNLEGSDVDLRGTAQPLQSNTEVTEPISIISAGKVRIFQPQQIALFGAAINPVNDRCHEMLQQAALVWHYTYDESKTMAILQKIESLREATSEPAWAAIATVREYIKKGIPLDLLSWFDLPKTGTSEFVKGQQLFLENT